MTPTTTTGRQASAWPGPCKGSTGLTGTIFGRNEGDSVIRGGFTRAFSREGMARFSDRFGANPGVTIDADPEPGQRQSSERCRCCSVIGSLAAPAVPADPAISADGRSSREDVEPHGSKPPGPVRRFLDDRAFSAAIGRNMAFEVRYVGTRSRDLWDTLNYNEINIFENGFLQRVPRRAGQPAGERRRQASANQGFAYRGPGTGNRAAADHVRVFPGCWRSERRRGVHVRRTSGRTTTLPDAAGDVQPEPVQLREQPVQATRRSGRTRRNAGLPANFFVANPDLIGGVDLTTNVGRSDYHALQLELRRRLSQGLQFSRELRVRQRRRCTRGRRSAATCS